MTVTLHLMVRGLNDRSGARRAQQVAETEQRLVTSATRLFVRDGYVGTTLAAVTADAGVAPRTLYLRFPTKTDLFRRVMDVAVVGDAARVDVAHRDWARLSLTAPTLDERMLLAARGARDIMARIGPLLPVAEAAASVEPAIATSASAARDATREQIRHFWTTAAGDGLLPDHVDLRWLADTAALLGAADTFLLGARLLHWTPDDFEVWLLTTWRAILGLPGALYGAAVGSPCSLVGGPGLPGTRSAG